MPLGEGFQRDENDAGAGTVGKAVDRQAGQGDGAFNAGLGQRDLAHLADHRLGTVERGTARQNLVDEYNGGFAAANDAGHAATVALRGAAEEAVEGGKEAAEVAVHLAGQPVRLGAVALEQHDREGR